MPGGVVLVQNLLISGIVGCFAATAQDLAEKRLTRPVRPAWFALVYLPFLLPPVLMHTQQPFRTTWSRWTELFLVFMLVAIYLRGTNEQKGAGRYRDSGHAGCVVAQRVRLYWPPSRCCWRCSAPAGCCARWRWAW